MIPSVVFLLALAQSGAEALSRQALEMAGQRRFDEAERLWTQALAASPGLFEANFNLGFLYYSNGNPAKAEPFLARAAKAKPADFNARYVWGATLAQLNRGDEALRQWRVALEIRPSHGKLMQIMAVEYSKGRYYRDAAAVAEKALQLDSGDANLYLIAIKAHQDASDHLAALRVAGEFVRRFPDSPRAAFEYGYELHRAGRPSEAMPFLKHAMEANGNYEEPFFFYGEILANERRFEESLEPFRKAIEIRRDFMAARTALARSLMALERYEEAERELVHAVGMDPRHPSPHLLLSQVYFRQGKEEAASREKEVSLRLRRENPEAMERPQGRPFPK